MVQRTARNKKSSILEIVPDVPEGLDVGLPNYWYPLLQTEELPAGKPVGLKALGQDIVFWRDGDGAPHAIRDHCPHRGTRLSVGEILNGDIQCVFHGLRFNGAGRCTLIPWEPDDSKLRDAVSLPSYPVRELGGYIWTYVGDAEKFPPPPLESEVPEELLDAERFVWFRYPTEIWNANWLLTLDGQDAFHSVILHARSQAMEDGSGHQVSMADRRVKITETSYGIRAFATDLEGTVVNQGHFSNVKGDRFVLPCLSTNPIRPMAQSDAYVVRVWQLPMDENRTLVARLASFRADTDAERARLKDFFDEIVCQRSSKVSAEDAFIAEAQGDLVAARSDEFLFWPDQETVKLRRLLKSAYLGQMDGKRTEITAEALAFPI